MNIPDIHIWRMVSDQHRADFMKRFVRLLTHHEHIMTDAALNRAALIADKVEAVAKPGDGKEAAAEIGRRIRAMLEVVHG